MDAALRDRSRAGDRAAIVHNGVGATFQAAPAALKGRPYVDFETKDDLKAVLYFAVMIAASVAIPFHRFPSRRFSLSVCWLSS
jgi:hypothetical protein